MWQAGMLPGPLKGNVMARENWDPEMLRFTEMMEARAAAQPPPTP